MMTFLGLKTECEDYYKMNIGEEQSIVYDKIIEAYISYCEEKGTSLRMESGNFSTTLKIDAAKFKETYLSYYDEGCQEKIYELLDKKNKANFKNWINGIVVPKKENIIEFVLMLIDFRVKKIDYFSFCNELLKVFGHDTLHARNVEDAFARFCLQKMKGYEFYKCNIETIYNYLDNIPKLISFNTKELFAITSKTMSINLSVIEDDKIKKEIQTLQEFFEKINIQSIEHIDSLSLLDNIIEQAELIKDLYNKGNHYIFLSKKKKERLEATIKTIDSIVQTIKNIIDERITSLPEILSGNNVDDEIEQYTTRFFASQQNYIDTFIDLQEYLHEYGRYFTQHRNKVVKNLYDALCTKYLKKNENGKFSIRKIAVDYENFFFSDEYEDLITMKSSRKQQMEKLEKNKANSTCCIFDTERELSKILSGKKNITRSTYISWLMFSELSLFDIDDYLEQSEFMTMQENEEEILSSMIIFSFWLKDKFKLGIDRVIIDIYNKWRSSKIAFEFPLYSYH